MISYSITFIITLYVAYFFYRYREVKRKYNEGHANDKELQKMTILVMLPLVFIFGVLPETEYNNAINGVIGILIIIVPILL